MTTSLGRSQLPGMQGAITPANIIAHIALVHNMTSWYPDINRSFWSLGLEWQWYWIFPLVILVAVRSTKVALLTCLGIAAVWHLAAHDSWTMWNGVSAALPARLFEFCCGIAVAQLVAQQWKWRGPTAVLVWGACLQIILAPIVPVQEFIQAVFGSADPLSGISFAFLLLLGQHSQVANRVLSSRMLVGLGTVSYSIYLLHEPIEEFVGYNSQDFLQNWLANDILAIGTAVGASLIFYWAIERKCLLPSTWAAVGQPLTRVFSWTDVVFRARGSSRSREIAVVPSWWDAHPEGIK